MIRFETLEEKEQQNNSMWWQKQFYKSITHEPLHRIVHIYFMFLNIILSNLELLHKQYYQL